MQRILVIRPGALGDTVLTLPALAALRAAFPGARLTFAGNRAMLPLILSGGYADCAVAADDSRLAPLFAPLEEEPSPALRSCFGDLDLAVLWLQDSAPVAKSLRRLGARAIVAAPSRPPEGTRQHAGDYLLSTLTPALAVAPTTLPRLPAPNATAPDARICHSERPAGREESIRLADQARFFARPRPVSSRLLAQNDRCGGSTRADFGKVEPKPLAPTLTGTSGLPHREGGTNEAFAAGFWQRHGLDGRPVVAIHPGSGGRWKCWPAARFALLADLLARQGAAVLLVAGPADDEVAAAFSRAVRFAQPVPAAGLHLPELAALLACCTAFAGNDSGVSHLTAALGIPTVAIYGPTDPAIWGVRGARVAHVRGRTLEEVSVGEVMRTLERLQGAPRLPRHA